MSAYTLSDIEDQLRTGDAVFQFVKRKLKRNRMTQQDLAGMLFTDRVTVYRRLKNQLPATKEFEDSLYQALNLTPDEKDELKMLFDITKAGKENLSLWMSMDRVLFGLRIPSAQSFNIRWNICSGGGAC
ncbi:MAG: hypothetical protein LBS84_10050 [Clostridiales bacterium]|jgi:transcriptional regulator with XRE-family HTH domain|nr:hypothetical protein [Clostridiales bacterium]